MKANNRATINEAEEKAEEKRLLDASKALIKRAQASMTPGTYSNHEDRCPPTVDAFEASNVGGDLIERYMK